MTAIRPAVLLGLILLVSALGHAANLVFDSSFENAAGNGTIADGWESMGAPPGGDNCVSDARAHSGKFSHMLRVPDAAPLNWYQIRQSVPLVKPGDTVTLSVYVATDNVRDGSGAYCSLNCFAGNNERIGIFDAESKAAGTSTGWQRQSVTATIPPRTNEVVIIFTLYGHGTAWFDDVQLEPGPQATDYVVSAVDLEAQERAAAQRQAAEGLAQSLQVKPGKLGTVAILRDTLPADGCASSPERLGKWLSAAGYGVCFLNAEQLSNPFILTGPAARGPDGGGTAAAIRPLLPPFDLLVLPYGGAFPATAATAMKSYLRQRGAFISMGGYAFDTLLVPHEGKWHKPQDLPLPAGGGVTIADFSQPADATAKSWWLGSDPGGNKPALKPVPGPNGLPSLEFSVNPLRHWATANHDVQARLPAPEATEGRPWTITRFWIKGDANTPKMAFEWDENDQSRWKVTVPLTTDWCEVVLTPSDFSYWHDNPSVGRGGPGDGFHPERAKVVCLGLALDIVDRDQPHSFQIAGLRVQSDPLADLRSRPKCLNTRVAKIRDAMWPDADQIPAFDPANRFEFVTGARPSANQFIAPAGNWQGQYAGYSAVAMLSNQGHGFGPNLSRLVPLLEATDRFGRNRGNLGSLVYHYDGFYRGSAGALFGVTNQDLFTDANPRAQALLVNTAQALTRRVLLHGTDTEFSSYRAGETVRFRTKASNFGMTDAAAAVAFTRDGAAASPAKQLVLQAGATEDVAVEVPVAALGNTSLCRFRFTVSVDGRPVDAEENAVVVWQGKADPSMARITRQGPYFAFGERPIFALGSQAYWGQNGSVTARSPLAFARDFALMQDYGMHFSRLFVPFKTESDMRQSDAMVQLAQQHRILFYHTPNLTNTAVPEELAAQTASSKRLGERYRDMPWLTVDVCNEPTVRPADEKLIPAFNEYLKTLYPTTDALRAAWGVSDVELGSVKPQPLSDRWDDLRAYDTHRFLTLVQQRWADANRGGVRDADPARLVSVGHMQGTGDGHTVWDPMICHANLDFTDRHYYGPPSAFPAQLKDIDQRVLGKPMLQGECGAKNHPTYETTDPWGMGDNDERFNHRFAYLVHHAFGLGATALASWHWRDPMEGIFPCGQVRSDRVPRPSASVMRAMAFTFGRLRPMFEMPQLVLVMPENHRLGGSRVAVTNAIHRAEEVLMSCHVDFGVISEARLPELPVQVKALVYPVPYCPSDETVAALQAFVQRGGALYFSGDISYDPQRKLTRAQRLTELAGVERTGVKDANVAPCLTTTLVTVKTAQMLLGLAPGSPTVVLKSLEEGQVFFCADPVETAKDQPAWHRPLMLEFLKRAGVARNAVTPDDAKLRCFRVPMQAGGAAYVLYNDNEGAVKASIAGVQVTLAPASPGLVVVDGQGRLTALETQGAVTHDGKTLLSAQGHVIVQSLDGKDLSATGQALILPFPGHGAVPPCAPGTGAPTGGMASLTWSGLAGKRVELGELQATKWTRLEPLAPARGRLQYDAEQALQMILAAAPAQFAAAQAAVERFATNP